MNDSTKNSILKTVEQKFRLGEVVLVVNPINQCSLLASWTFRNPYKKSSLSQANSHKTETSSESLQIFEAYQIVGAEHQNRLLAIVRSGMSSALFSFNVSTYPPINLSDLHIESVFKINETFLIDSSSGFGVSSYQFQILSGNEQTLYYYYPDDETCKAKMSFERILRKLIQGERLLA